MTERNRSNHRAAYGDAAAESCRLRGTTSSAKLGEQRQLESAESNGADPEEEHDRIECPRQAAARNAEHDAHDARDHGEGHEHRLAAAAERAVADEAAHGTDDRSCDLCEREQRAR